MTYQDQWAGGQAVRSGYRECADRYDVVRRAVAGLRRPFTVLDLGAAGGYFSARLTDEFGARCVAVDPSPDLAAMEGRIASVVRQRMTAVDLPRQGTFDVVLMLSFLHHCTDWRDMLATALRLTRRVAIIETPDPDEQLRQAPARHELDRIDAAIRGGHGGERVGAAPSVWNDAIERPIYRVSRPGLHLRGKVFSGSGNHGAFAPGFLDDLEPVLGYRPFPGSLNVRLNRIPRLGPYALEFVDARRGRGGKQGGDYQVWHARLNGIDCHAFRPGARLHGKDVLELWAPVRLRDALGLEDGATVTVEVGA